MKLLLKVELGEWLADRPPNQTLGIWNSGDGTLSWSLSDNAAWLLLFPTSGTSTGETDNVMVRVITSGMAAGSYSASITISAPGATNTPQTVPVSLTIVPEEGLVLTFPHGLGQDPTAVFPRLYDGAEVTLPTGTEPPELLIVWYYDEALMQWLFYVPGWESTLTKLEYWRIYATIVSDACTWDIPQP